MNRSFESLRWIARLSSENCPGGVPTDEAGWRELVNRMVRDVRRALSESDGSDRSDRSDGSGGSGGSDGSDGLIQKHGGYRRLKSFQVASLVYDATVLFCDRFISKRSRTHDQMVQAARSGRQNIAEGSAASGTSRKFELKLTNVAKASLEELLLDYEDYLRQHGLRRWDKDDLRPLRCGSATVPIRRSGSLTIAPKTNGWIPTAQPRAPPKRWRIPCCA